MRRKDELLAKAQTTGLSKAERGELRELHIWEEKQIKKAQNALENSVHNFKDEYDTLNMPRHRALDKGIYFLECPFCHKNRNTHSRLIKEYNHMQKNPDDYCMKPQLHNEKTFSKLITRDRIDLDQEEGALV